MQTSIGKNKETAVRKIHIDRCKRKQKGKQEEDNGSKQTNKNRHEKVQK